jgi:hypothetical protein
MKVAGMRHGKRTAEACGQRRKAVREFVVLISSVGQARLRDDAGCSCQKSHLILAPM